ncbi:LOW QUALITY PROTEIN: leucine-rich repeat-containing protein 7-like [Nylanderia fulva]|uniref:LOW QUALITY PROTEIN: leucine-rich repeat-containing protein 7-like n=1 Tax=Nylanderia fulva TaxID=613905 RepID=UPI0010FB49AA|nr:LOW QUALITY PROTEIN: leucine-rich repeat-containing protein 7-like [Nylanderia fulva]
MSIFIFHGFLLLCFVQVTIPNVEVLNLAEIATNIDLNSPQKCRYSRANSILEARCSNLDLQKIPLDLKTNIQVLDFNSNRVRELKNDSLQPYNKLAFIYLGYNLIRKIEEAAFANQPYLEVLDLTDNNCRNLPKSLFQLPYLRTLYLSHNEFTDSVFKVNVTSPLRLLHLTNNKLNKIPNIGVQPTLLNLDVSDNFITSISTEDLAPFCSLKELDLIGNSISFKAGSCNCHTFNAWVKLRKIKMQPNYLYKCINSPTLNKACANVTFSNRTYELYHECLAMMHQKMKTEQARSFLIRVALSISVFLFVVFVALFCVCKRNRRQRRRQKEQLTVNNDNMKLLNSNLTIINEILVDRMQNSVRRT